MKISIGAYVKDGPWGGGNLFFENLKIDNSNENFLILCMNYSRAAYGDNYKGKISEKCQSIFVNKKIKILDEIKIPDFLIYIASQKS